MLIFSCGLKYAKVDENLFVEIIALNGTCPNLISPTRVRNSVAMETMFKLENIIAPRKLINRS